MLLGTVSAHGSQLFNLLGEQSGVPIEYFEDSLGCPRFHGHTTIIGDMGHWGKFDGPVAQHTLKWLLTGDPTSFSAMAEWYRQSVGFDPEEIHEVKNKPTTWIKPKEEAPAQPGHIYVVRSGEHFKIGKASDLKARLSTHQTSSPELLDVVIAVEVDDMTHTERELHEIFSEKRVRGEWFKLDGQDLETLTRYFTDGEEDICNKNPNPIK